MGLTGLYSKVLSCIGSKSALIVCFTNFSGNSAYAFILGVLLICGLGVPIPEDITLVAAGILAALGKISLIGAICAGLLGVLLGDTFLFFLGRHLGYRVFDLPILRHIISEKRVKRAEQKVLNNAKFICFMARFLPGLRSPIILTTGVMGVKPIVFLGLDGLAALLSVPFWVYVGWWFGEKWDENLKIIEKMQVFLIVAVVIIIGLYFMIKKWWSRS